MTSVMENTNLPFRQWSPPLVEELLFRRYIKKEDVTSFLPESPLPGTGGATGSLTDSYDRSAKMLFHYIRNGPLAALAPQNVNTANSIPRGKVAGSSNHLSPAVGEVKRKGTLSSARPPSPLPSSDGLSYRPVQKTAVRVPSPGAVLSSSPSAVAAAAAAPLPSPKPAPSKKIRIEWPPGVPSNHSLHSSRRSNVQHLTAQRIAAQENIDPDLIFKQNPGDLPLHQIFAQFPTALATISENRNASGDWCHDTFSQEEEEQYKRDGAYYYKGPSQCYAQGTDELGNAVWIARK